MPFDEKNIYEDLVYEICGKEQVKYDSLVVFVHNFLNKKVKFWCYKDSILRGGLHHEDVMQEIQIRIIQKCERYFFKPENGATDKTCEEFKAWCYRVAKNYFLTYCVNQKDRKEVELNLSIRADDSQSEHQMPEDDFYRKEILEDNQTDLIKCFTIVIDLNSSPHVILTWLSVSLFMLEFDVNRKDAMHNVIKKFSELTLFDMFDIIVTSIRNLGWMVISNEEVLKQKNRLQSINPKTGKMIGNMKYGEFYMNKGPEMSISDWVNRVNSQIKNKWVFE